ncbi:hypothetical protein CWI80_10285 [Pseudidiomarina sediminum]|uniref:Uncharacterized protein n=1 Tax=Pseudidiomarina sediminum TaxID=431675 RepID=A0A432Z2T2_9GAMM|nr:hypothetical protein CWI80_10285 [Pseudidiomarina sediminum]
MGKETRAGSLGLTLYLGGSSDGDEVLLQAASKKALQMTVKKQPSGRLAENMRTSRFLEFGGRNSDEKPQKIQ